MMRAILFSCLISWYVVRQVVFQLIAADESKTVSSSPILRPLASGPHVGVLRRLLVRVWIENKPRSRRAEPT